MEDSSRHETVASEDEQSFDKRSKRERRSMQNLIYSFDKIPNRLTLRDLQNDDDYEVATLRKPAKTPTMNVITEAELDREMCRIDGSLDEQNKTQYLKSLYKKIKQVETHALILGYVSLAVGIVWPILYHLFKN